MPFLRLSRDHRGYETTVLLHVPHPGDRPRVLYWYRSAPGVRVGRPALDEDAIRTIEDQHPDIDFDWPHILEVGAASIIEVERRPERNGRGRGAEGERARRKGERARDQTAAAPAVTAPEPVEPLPQLDADGEEQPLNGEEEAAADADAEAPVHAPDILAELVGREIATRLRARYAEISARIHQLPADEVTRAAWHARAEPLDPDSWLTPHEILKGVSHADELFDALRRELVGK